MKRNYLLIGTGAVGLLLILASVVLSFSSAPGEESMNQATALSIPDNLKPVFKNSCMECHATDGRKMAAAKINFTNWDNYEPAQQAKKAVAICNKVTAGSMPPKSFVSSNPGAILTAEQKDLICKWSGK
jgi:hypothetical protein